MTPAGRRRTLSATLLSAVAHVAVLTVLWLQRPTLPLDLEPAGPPEAIIPVLILPRVPPPAAGTAAPAPIRLHRRSQRFAAEPSPVAPLRIPEPKAPARRASPAPAGQPQAPGLPKQIRETLRLGRVGCANAEALKLNRAEREACDEQFAAGAQDAPYIAPPMSASKRAALQAAAGRREADRRYREANLPPGVGPDGPLGPPTDSRGELKIPF